MSNGFDEREKAFEEKWAHDEKLRFKVEARRDKLVGLWAAGEMGLRGAEAEAYAKTIVEADMTEAGDEDVFKQIARRFRRQGHRPHRPSDPQQDGRMPGRGQEPGHARHRNRPLDAAPQPRQRLREAAGQRDGEVPHLHPVIARAFGRQARHPRGIDQPGAVGAHEAARAPVPPRAPKAAMRISGRRPSSSTNST